VTEFLHPAQMRPHLGFVFRVIRIPPHICRDPVAKRVTPRFPGWNIPESIRRARPF
jgi:hypothetical protein